MKSCKSKSGFKFNATYKFCGCTARTFATGHLIPPDDVKGAFLKFAIDGVMNKEDLLRFLHEVQGQTDLTIKDAESIISSQLCESKTFPRPGRHGLNEKTFFHFLLNPRLNPPIDAKVHHDMSKPFSQYYIHTGHNSYLTGNQLNSDASEKPIIEALQKGVRVIELDLWSDSSNKEILVKHGGTLTSPIGFAVCIEAIKAHAFVASDYPVVITLEDHLKPPLQAKAAEIITTILGGVLYYPGPGKCFKEFPSPEFLKKRILISTKPPTKESFEASTAIEENGEKEGWGEEIPTFEFDKFLAVQGQTDLSDDEGDTESDEKKEDQCEEKKAVEYEHIISIHSGKPKGGSLRTALAVVENKVKRVSLSEPQLEKLAKRHPTDVVCFTQKNILRIYPYGLRVDSSNYNPHIAWAHGAQMVAFNMQGHGRPLWVVQGFFKANGKCGYVKKPDFLLSLADNNEIFNPQKVVPVKKTLKVKVYMGLGFREKFGKRHFDAYSPPDFYTRIGIAGVPADQVMEKTDIIEDEWIPHWNKEFKFPLTVPEIAVLRIEVHEYDMLEKDDFAGQVALPISELQTGFRNVTLCDTSGNEITGVKLLMRFELI